LKERILLAAITELKSNGIRFTMDNVAKRIGISKRTLYQYFPSKALIIEAIVDITLMQLEQETNEIIEHEQLSIIDKIKGVISLLPSHYQIYDLRILEDMERYYPEQWAKVDAELKDDWKALERLFIKGIEKGEIVSDYPLPIIMKLLTDTTKGVLKDQSFCINNKIDVSEALAHIGDMLLHGLIVKNKK
jgi:AcrR family transcriptional regulator